MTTSRKAQKRRLLDWFVLFLYSVAYDKEKKNRPYANKFPFFGHTYHMIKPTKNIKEIKQMVKECSAQHVAVQVNLGRNKHVHYSGVLSGIYPAIFTVKPDDENFLGKTAYSYADVLSGNVKIERL